MQAQTAPCPCSDKLTAATRDPLSAAP
jgi:hypothetical protein